MTGNVVDHDHEWSPAGAVLQDGWRVVWICDVVDCWAWTVTTQQMEHYVEVTDAPSREDVKQDA